MTVGDGLDPIARGLGELVAGHDLVVTSGGLGPTHDDRTVEAIAGLAGVELVIDQDVLDRVNRWTAEVAARNGFDPDRFDAGNLKQAHIPAGSEVLGLAGTAPGLVLNVGSAAVVVLPGVPSELRRLWELAPQHPRLAGLFARARPRARTAASHLWDGRVARGRYLRRPGRRPRRRGDIDLRAQVRGRDRHPRRPGRRAAGHRVRRRHAPRAGRLRVCHRRGPGGRDRCRCDRRPRLDAGHRGVVHGRCDRPADHRYPR